ncbi:MAG: hypothetical protein JSW12_10690 [Deltaproteobacteria bacterium]|nr:MAG: hypothetical protein JSW12_10690 [Deltaproteobacteria bacterium]
MSYFSFRVLFICIFFPPVLYVFSVQGLEQYLQNKRTKQVQSTTIQEFDAVYSGRYSITEEISTNLERYAREDKLRSLGVITKIVVSTKNGKLLYPQYYEEKDIDFDKKTEFDTGSSELFNYIRIAQENFRILNEGLIVSVDVEVRHNSWLTNSILILYIFSSILILYGYYKKRAREWVVKAEDEQKRIEAISANLTESEKSLQELSQKEQDYISKIQSLTTDREKLRSDITLLMDEVELQKKKSLEIDEILDEMERLEEQASKNIALREDKEREIIQLKEEIDQLEMTGKQGAKKRKKDMDSIKKRFSVIYKNLNFHDRAIEGYSLLPQDFQLKAEEMIHRLNEDDSLVTVKRKVFGKKGKLNIFEAIFSYSGRIYFRKKDNNRMEIVAIGTKNTQEQDIAFMEGIS